MRIRVRAFSTLRDRLGDEEVKLNVEGNASVRDALATLEAEYSELAGELLADGEIPATVTILWNGQRVNDPDTVTLDAGDELVLAPPITGGCGGFRHVASRYSIPMRSDD